MNKIKQIIKEEIDSFDWVDDIPHEKSIGEIKKLYNGFRELFEVGDTLVVTGSIPCESMRNEGCVINLSNHEFRVGGVYRTRVKIIAIDDEMISQFVDEWGEDEVWLGVESSDDDITLHKKNDINEDFDWVEDVPPKLTVDQLKKGDIYIYNHPTGAQFRLKYNHEPGITNEWGTTTTYAFDWMKNGQRINFSPKDIQRHIETEKLVKESNEFDWAEDIDGEANINMKC
jgi:hypothetical protein